MTLRKSVGNVKNRTMEKAIFKIEKTEKGIDFEIKGDRAAVINGIANVFINDEYALNVVSDAQLVAFKELKRRDQEKQPKSKLIIS